MTRQGDLLNDFGEGGVSTLPALNAKTSRMAHANDPSSSHKAAERNVTSGANASQKALALELVARYPDRTATELALHVEVWDQSVKVNAVTLRRRLGELERDGLVVRTPGPGELRRRITESGREQLRRVSE